MFLDNKVCHFVDIRRSVTSQDNERQRMLIFRFDVVDSLSNAAQTLADTGSDPAWT
jgi:hypothetical protein